MAQLLRHWNEYLRRTYYTGPDPGFSVGGGHGPILGGFGLQRGHFSVKMYAKMKELGPVGGGVCRARPPRSAYAIV